MNLYIIFDLTTIMGSAQDEFLSRYILYRNIFYMYILFLNSFLPCPGNVAFLCQKSKQTSIRGSRQITDHASSLPHVVKTVTGTGLAMIRASVNGLAIVSRLVIIGLQFVANHLIQDHQAGVFVSPKSLDAYQSKHDWLVEAALGGFRRWDAHYFLHVAEYGYTYENTLAFFPLYPLCLRIIGQLVHVVLPVFSLRATLLIVAVSLNVFLFVKAAEALYELSKLVFRDRIRAKIAVAFFCINPASIFFSAPYSESLFCWLTFAFLRQCLQEEISVSQTFPLSLSILCRSNGLINVGFLIFFALRRLFNQFDVSTFLTVVLKSAVITFFVVFHFGLLHAYHFYLFCHHLNVNFPKQIINYASVHGLVLAGNKTDETSPWCTNAIPMAYSYVQDKYWDVGFLRYYQTKQLPNFLLASPVIVTILWHFLQYFRKHTRFTLRLGLLTPPSTANAMTHYSRASFVFLIHATVLTVFCLLFVHVQVTTRMLASSSPILYWIIANQFHYVKSVMPEPSQSEAMRKKLVDKPKIFNIEEETDTVDTGYFMNILRDKSNLCGRLFCIWFLLYFVIGTVLFSNFFPWT